MNHDSFILEIQKETGLDVTEMRHACEDKITLRLQKTFLLDDILSTGVIGISNKFFSGSNLVKRLRAEAEATRANYEMYKSDSIACREEIAELKKRLEEYGGGKK